MQDQPKDALFLALDVKDARAAEPLIKQLQPAVGGFKVGAELFLESGPSICDLIVGLGAALFIDLKLHDIPRTVEAGAKRLAKLGAKYITVHALGGTEMLEAAVQGAAANSKTRVLAVTMLTSHTQQTVTDLGIVDTVEGEVLRLAELAAKAKVPGLVCSAHEVPALRERFGKRTELVCPGIRLEGGTAHDQKRVATPRAAIQTGADVLVVGRAILDSPDRLAATQGVLTEIAHGFSARAR
ncbi:MAG: orotidine-5'-phosphate decarboxylase [Deltaproteobacteria bacterium]|nr:orotidine-5'-phosphate decarboxylase [Deltaproteobacteria bacterium]